MQGRRVARLAILLLALAVLVVPALAPAQDPGPDVIGGTPAEPGEYPWQVAVFTQKYFCGGTLIADKQVVTAAHCVSDPAPPANKIKVLVGQQSRTSTAPRLDVASYAVHNNYNKSTFENDVAVLQLVQSGIAAGGESLPLIGQEGLSDDGFWDPGDMLAISGWGTTSSSGGSLPDQLREAEVPRVDDTTCGQDDWYGDLFFPATMVCAGFPDGGVDTCSGDSGGPMAAPIVDNASATDPSKWRLVGITSWGTGCALAKKPGVYTRVAAPGIRSFILSNTGTPTTFPLAVTVTGGGTVTSSPAGIACPNDCSQNYTNQQLVALTAHPNQGESFIGWGEDCSGVATTTCTLTMDAAHTVTATFSSTTPITHTLTVVKSGTGSGNVTSSPGGINCGADCSQSYGNGQTVTLAASAAAGSTFSGWTDPGCRSTGPCSVLMDSDRSVTATFTAKSSQPGPGPTPTPEPEPGTADDTPPVAAIASDALHMSRRGFVKVQVDCVDSPEDCLGDLRIRMRFPRDIARLALLSSVAHKKFEIAAGESKRVKARLRRRARHRVREKGHVRVRVVVLVEDAAGNTDKLRKKLVLSAPE